MPTVSAEFVWRMAELLGLYAEPYDPQYPVICVDESPYQLVSEARQPLPMVPGQLLRYDDEYRREGTCNLFMLFQPLQGWRHVKVTDRRTAKDFAYCMQELVDVHFPKAAVISVVLDNLNTHTPAAVYEAFPPVQARRLLRKLDWRYTPKHGSWLNMAEIEFAVVSKQGLDQRLPTQERVRRTTTAWETQRNAVQATVNWRFTIAKARRKLKRLYPSQPLC
jgi:transposase